MNTPKNKISDNTSSQPDLLSAAAAAVPNSAKFDLDKDEIVKQVLTVPMIKVLPNSPTVARLFENKTVRLLRLDKQSKKVLYICKPELFEEPALEPFFYTFMIASGRTGDGEQFLAYCQMPDAEQPNRFHTSGLQAMQMALKEPVARKPWQVGDTSYVVMRYGPEATPPEIKKPDYSLSELFSLAFDGLEVLDHRSAIIVDLKSLQVQAD
jgi:hypothetical protein